MDRLSYWSIRTRLLLSMLVAFLPALAIILVTGFELRGRAVGSAETFALRQVQAMAEHHRQVVDNAKLLLMTLSKTDEARTLNVIPCLNLLEEVQRRTPAYISLLLADLQGNVLAAAPAGQYSGIFGSQHFREALRGMSFVTGDYVLHQDIRRVVIHFAQPVSDYADEPVGVLVAQFDLNYFGQLFYAMDLPDTSVFTLTDVNSVRLTRFPETEKYTWVPDLPRMVELMTSQGEEGTFLEKGVDGISRLYGFKRIHFEGAPFPYLMLRLGIPVEQALGEANALTIRNLVLFVLAAGLCLFCVYALSRFAILHPLNRLVEAAEQLGKGDLATRTGLSHGTSELSRLAAAFDVMADELQLREEERRLAEEQVCCLNEELEARVARRTEELAVANRELNQALEGLRQTQDQLVQSEKLAALGSLVAGVAHEINTPVGVGVTATSHLEQKTRDIASRYAQGAITRADLEEYLGVASEATSMILTNLDRAANLIKSFKQVAVDQASGECRTFNVRSYVEEFLLSLRPKLKKTKLKVEVRCDPELTIVSYPGALSQILTNFIVNSLKHGYDEGDSGTIVIDIVASPDALILTYSDDGKGMPPEHLARIFEPFFTTARGKGGSGLGLSIVYNIVAQTLGGRILCTSHPGQGTTFTITIPLSQGAEHAQTG